MKAAIKMCGVAKYVRNYKHIQGWNEGMKAAVKEKKKSWKTNDSKDNKNKEMER